ncbi:hypothetical protein QTI33_07820 [Variovorax sp. J22P271]|nr:hypothetical protein [Variovorax sp. J22P271]
MELDRNGGAPGTYTRFLNIDGRWAVHGSQHAPLLVWDPAYADLANAAAARATAARQRPVVVLSRGDSGWEEGREIQVFIEAFESALLGHTAHSAAKARRLRTEADKLEAFSLIVRQASAAMDHEPFASVRLAAGKALLAKFGGGSITSAFAWLAGKAGSAALASVLSGEVELAGPLSTKEVADAVALAREADRLQGAQGS